MPKAQKGSQYERDTCKKLSLWWTQDLDKPRDDVFWRTSQSGGRATTRAKKNIKTAYSYGDVTFIDPIGKPFIDSCLVELKRGYTNSISVLDFLDSGKATPLLYKWYEKGDGERELAKRKYAIIIFRRDRHRSCVFFDTTLFNEVQDWFGIFTNNNITIRIEASEFVVLELDKFLDWCHPDFFNGE